MSAIAGSRIATNSPDYDSGLAGALNSINGVELETASGAIGIKEGTAVITAASALALTLVAPTAGEPSAGGDDGKELTVLSNTGYAHTVTTPSATIQDGTGTNKDTATFAAHAGASITLQAYNGLWNSVRTTAVTLTEV